MRVISKNKIQPDIIGHANGAPLPLRPANTTHFRLPPRKAPYLAFILLTAICLFAAAQFYQPTPVIIAPASAAPLAAPTIGTPSKPEIDDLASLMPAEAAEPLPIKPLPLKDIDAKPRIRISQPAARPTSGKLIRQGIALSKAGQPAAALETFNDARKLDPKNPAVLYNIAVLNDRMGDSPEAAKFYKATLRSAPLPPSLNSAFIKKRLSQLAAENRQE